MSLAFAAWELAYQLRFLWIDLPHASMIPSHAEYLKAAFFVAVLTGFVFSFSGVYKLHKVVHPPQEFYHLLRGTFTLLLLTLVTAFSTVNFLFHAYTRFTFLLVY